MEVDRGGCSDGDGEGDGEADLEDADLDVDARICEWVGGTSDECGDVPAGLATTDAHDLDVDSLEIVRVACGTAAIAVG